MKLLTEENLLKSKGQWYCLNHINPRLSFQLFVHEIFYKKNNDNDKVEISIQFESRFTKQMCLYFSKEPNGGVPMCNCSY